MSGQASWLPPTLFPVGPNSNKGAVVFSSFMRQHLENGIYVQKLLLMTNRKLIMRFRLAPWSMTLDDFERLWVRISSKFALSNFKHIRQVAALSRVTLASAGLSLLLLAGCRGNRRWVQLTSTTHHQSTNISIWAPRTSWRCYTVCHPSSRMSSTRPSGWNTKNSSTTCLACVRHPTIHFILKRSAYNRLIILMYIICLQ